MIAITGASGHLGRLVIDALLKSTPPDQIVALVRSPAKVADLAAKGVHVREADFDQPETWPTALTGVTRLLLISSNNLVDRPKKHAVAIDAARAAGVKQIAYTSLINADSSVVSFAKDHRETEAHLKASGVPYVALRNGWYIENYTAMAGMAVQHGAVIGSSGDGKIAGATRQDFAEAAAAVLADPEIGPSRVYELAGDTSFTMSDYAVELSKAAGKSVTWTNLPEAEYAKILVSNGLPEAVATFVAALDISVANGAVDSSSTDLSRLIGRPSTPLAVAIKQALA